MSGIAAAAAIAGTGLQVYGDIQSAKDQAGLDEDRARIANEQADELASRELANENIRNQQAMRQKLQFGASYAATGKEGVGVGSQLQIQAQADLMNMMSNRESMFQQHMLHTQAGIDTTMADETRSAGNLHAVADLLGGGGKAASILTMGGNNPGYGGTQGLGSYPTPDTESNFKMPQLGSGMYNKPGSYGGG